MNSHTGKTGINNLFHALSVTQRIALIFALPLLAASHFALAQTTAPGASGFDHIKTGFYLSGAHVQAKCESCHIHGIFKGTPRDCAGCHLAGNRMGATAKPGRHVPSVSPCDSCHRTAGWTPASFSHAGVAPGACATCHNGSTAASKPGSHVLTTASCDSCHRTLAWIPAGYNHRGVTPGTCATCHNGTTATGKPGGHITTADSCDNCHRTTAWIPAGYNHTGVVPGTCATCHNGATAIGKPSNHIPESQLLNGLSMSCDSCHTSMTSFTAINMNHNNSQGNGSGWCKSCHATGTSYLGNMEKKSLTHESTGKTDCSESGCHRPLGTNGAAYTKWD
ncbi:MAG: hypothetical protein NUV63_12440 [Gallionella sp.]|nr:hypothetical protein [Gallionella sp.]